MKKQELDDLLERKVLTQDEYDEFFKSMKPNEKGEMFGVVPSVKYSRKYYMDGDMSNLVEFILKEVTPMLGAESWDDVFKTYGYTFCGICDGYRWFTNKSDVATYNTQTINDTAREHGMKPLEEASELELWKIIAICERYWGVQYQRWYHGK